ncbi:MAG: GNAT family N-acetyltransferase [Chloroflexi bacterium]|nr:GNAT family N-acetyltransferase [Chloroflexota bacterium]
MSDIPGPQPRFTRQDVEFREAMASDRAEIERIASQTWEGRDYLPRVFDQWINDPDGSFSVMIYQGTIVGVGKLTRLDEDEWWLEGLRIDPAYRGRGLARVMHHFIVSQARQVAKGEVGFATAATNTAVVKLASETGFQRTADFKVLQHTATPTANSGEWRLLQKTDIPRLEAWLAESLLFNETAERFEHRWTWYRATRPILEQLIEAGQIYSWHPQGEQDELAGVLVANPLRQDRPEDEPVVSFAFADALPEWRQQLWNAAAQIVATRGGQRATIKIPDRPEFTQPLMDAGWEVRDSHPVLFIRPIVLTEESDVRFEEVPTVE